jgi:hypothetical protein
MLKLAPAIKTRLVYTSFKNNPQQLASLGEGQQGALTPLGFLGFDTGYLELFSLTF